MSASLPGGFLTRFPRAAIFDPRTGELLDAGSVGVLPTTVIVWKGGTVRVAYPLPVSIIVGERFPCAN